MKAILIAPSVTASRGDAHFHRGLLQELALRGHHAVCLCPSGSGDPGETLSERVPLAADYPDIDLVDHCGTERIEAEIEDADLILVHDRAPASLRDRLARKRCSGWQGRLLLHDTHVRAPEPGEICAPLDVDGFDGILAGSGALAAAYAGKGWGPRVIRWPPAADTRVFAPLPSPRRDAGALLVAHWGPARSEREFVSWFIEPVRAAGLHATVAGGGYSFAAQEHMHDAGIARPRVVMNTALPKLFSRHRVAVRPFSSLARSRLPGKPPLPMLEAMACGIPVVRPCGADPDGCFEPGEDHLTAASPDMMRAQIQRLVLDTAFADALGRAARDRVVNDHSCVRRADQLLEFAIFIGAAPQKRPQRVSA